MFANGNHHLSKLSDLTVISMTKICWFCLCFLAPPRFSSPLNNRTQNVNSQLGVECEVNAMPVPHYQWLFNGSVIARQKSLNLSSVSPVDQGFYTCIANNSLGSVQDRFYLTIQGKTGARIVCCMSTSLEFM